MIQAYFISDIHIRSVEESNSQKLLLFLRSLADGTRPATHLFLVGDIFDLWIHDHTYFVEKYTKTVNAIKVLVEKGIEVHYFEGNHDLFLLKFWQQEVGVKVHEGPAFFNIGQKIIRVEHGDFMNPDDRGYLFLRAFLRSRPMSFVAKNLPGQWVKWIGQKASKASRHYTSHQKSVEDQRAKEIMHGYALKVIAERHFDYLITGHTHVRDVYKFRNEGREIVSINLGSWFEDQKALLINSSGYQFIDIKS